MNTFRPAFAANIFELNGSGLSDFETDLANEEETRTLCTIT
jgi:hypothetical protein